MDRTGIARSLLAAEEADALVISSLPDVRWLTGFSGSNGIAVVSEDRAVLITDLRYQTQALREASGFDVHIAPTSLYAALGELNLVREGSITLFQADHLPCSALDRLRSVVQNTKWVGREGLLSAHVARKEEHEIATIRKAQALTESVFDEVLRDIRPGLREFEIAAEIVCGHLRRGAERMSFDPIVASGPNGALPHARPTDRKLTDGDLVVLDFGCVVDGYASDMTRTIAVGTPSDSAVRVYAAVRRALEEAVESARPGMIARDLDAVARSSLHDAGLAEHFAHGLGHGIGLRTHETPRVSFSSLDVLPENAVVTIEPGVYLLDQFGVRIEDMVVLRQDGAEVLTSTPRDLIHVQL